MERLKNTLTVIRLLGPRWVGRRALYALRRRLGAIRQSTPLVAWHGLQAPVLQLCARRRSFEPACSLVLAGSFPLFSARRQDCGLPPNWFRNQLTGEIARSDCHWTELRDFGGGDIKGVWELSRFGWAYELVRDGSNRAGGVFWALFADWVDRNPPNRGPNWMCGQEASIRLIAVVFAAEYFGVPEVHRDALARFVVATGRRVEANIGYALAQHNNHGISECVGLITAAVVSGRTSDSDRWLQVGTAQLKNQLDQLLYSDGAFSQHSLIYHRLTLDMLAWAALRLGSAHHTVPEWLLEAGRRATRFLAAITDPATGNAPLYGTNDGAQLFPLTECEFGDMRPTVGLGAAVFFGEQWYPEGPWQETTSWLMERGQLARREIGQLENWHAPQGGLLQLVSGPDRLILRCPTQYRHRPGQADLGHVDVWLGGHPVAVDGGTYSYNSRERFVNLAKAREHNAITIDGREPMRKLTRFLFSPWPRGSVSTDQGRWSYQPEVEAYRPTKWRRSVEPRGGGGFVVTDELNDVSGREVRWHWRLVDVPWRLEKNSVVAGDITVRWSTATDLRVDLVRADPNSASGWASPRYSEVRPAVSLIVTATISHAATVSFEFSRAYR